MLNRALLWVVFLLMLSGLVFCMSAAVMVPPAHAESVRRLEGVVNLNTATPDELRLLPGIGPAKVRNVIAYRQAHLFRTVDELVRIKGVGRKMVRRLRLHLAVSGPTTAQQVIRAAGPTGPITPGAPPPLLATTAPASVAPKWVGGPRMPAVPARPPAATKAVVPPGTVGARPAIPARRLLPNIVFPEAEANHCTRGP